MRKNPEHFGLREYAAFGAVTLMVMLLCICVGSVALPVKERLYLVTEDRNGCPEAECIPFHRTEKSRQGSCRLFKGSINN